MLVRRLSLVPCQVKALDSTFPEVFSSSSSSLVWWYEWFSVTAAAAAAVYRHSLFKGHDAHSKEEENALSTILPDWVLGGNLSSEHSTLFNEKAQSNWSYIIHRSAVRLLLLDNITPGPWALRLNSHFSHIWFLQSAHPSAYERLSSKTVYSTGWYIRKNLNVSEPLLGTKVCQLYRRGCCSSDLFYYWCMTLGECRSAKLKLEKMLCFLASKCKNIEL